MYVNDIEGIKLTLNAEDVTEIAFVFKHSIEDSLEHYLYWYYKQTDGEKNINSFMKYIRTKDKLGSKIEKAKFFAEISGLSNIYERLLTDIENKFNKYVPKDDLKL